MSLEDAGGYVVLSMVDIGDVPCRCGSCKWRGSRSELVDVKACELKPGDLSPAGRCPKCRDLCYPDRLQDRQICYADQLHDMLSRIVEINEKLAAGKRFQGQSLASLVADGQALLKAVRGKKLPAKRNESSDAIEPQDKPV